MAQVTTMVPDPTQCLHQVQPPYVQNEDSGPMTADSA